MIRIGRGAKDKLFLLGRTDRLDHKLTKIVYLTVIMLMHNYAGHDKCFLPVAAPAHNISQVISRSDTHQARSVNPRITPPLYFSTQTCPRGFFGNVSVYLSAIHFHIFWCKNLKKIELLRESIYQKLKCLGGWLPSPSRRSQLL